ncbi:hypothetical protein V2I01_32750 [Micromonospora sp. BRA006-A]|nr:hypothetical protein [Micromonospora sp. BRA006-A]
MRRFGAPEVVGRVVDPVVGFEERVRRGVGAVAVVAAGGVVSYGS